MITNLDDIAMHRNNAQLYRGKAREMQEAGHNEAAAALFKDAVAEHQKAIRIIRRELRTVRADPQRRPREEGKLLQLLSQALGALGGTWRDAGCLAEAIKAYDEGYTVEVERQRLYQDDDSYNLLQRLVTRLLSKPDALDHSNQAVVSELNVPEALQAAYKEIERQVVVDKTRGDSWAKADLALVRILLGQQAKDVLNDLEMSHPDHSFYISTHTVIKSLIKEGLGKKEELRNRLQDFKSLLEHKSGLVR